MPPADPLEPFHPIVRQWFVRRFGSPTEIQRRAWPEIARGRHTLLTAPTGSGKTLTAFLWALDQLLTGAWPAGQVAVLYVSPLKALNNDVQRNLLQPLAELAAAFAAAGEEVPAIRVATRSGDTSSEERRRTIRHPPEILVTTPESLNVMLTSSSGRRLLATVSTVILDEIHAVAASKRGTHLVTAVDRLVPLAGEFQRIALSATARPLERIAELVGGLVREGRGEDAVLTRRPVVIVEAPAGKRYELSVAAPAAEALDAGGDLPEVAGEGSIWAPLAAELKRLVLAHHSTLVFANSRRLTERVTRFLNEGRDRELAYSHHGSLSREIRAVVEQRLKNGELAAIVATNSLELGIDIGHLDLVVLIQAPPTVASAVQRIGRAGHGVGEVSRARVFSTHPRDLLAAAVVARAVLDGDVEEVRPVEGALDVLAQVLLSMVAAQEATVDSLFDLLRTSWPYRNLKRSQLELVLEMLAGRWADSRLRELKPRISIDRVSGRVTARPGAARLVYLAGGTIPDRGYYTLRLADSGAKLGELDEEFVWERSIGDSFNLGAQNWRIQRITHNDVLVAPARATAGLAPFWRADSRDRGHHLASRIGRFLAAADGRLEDPGFAVELHERYCLEAGAVQELLALLRRQKEVTGCDLPHERHLVVEHFRDPYGAGRRPQMILHTGWGGEVNRPFAIALAEAMEERWGLPAEIAHDDDCVNVVFPTGASPEDGPPGADVLSLVDDVNLERLLRRRLERTGFFGSRFRHAASTALLLPRAGFDRRTPLWLSRLKAKQLLEVVSRSEDFPMLAETWRTCLVDELDLGNLRRLLAELARGEIRVSHAWTTAASPFAEGLIWKQTNQHMYEDDTPQGRGASRLSDELLRELVFASHLRPRLEPALIRLFEAKAQRTAPGWAPRPGAELADWVRERLLVPAAEWRALEKAVERDWPAAEHDWPGAEGGSPPQAELTGRLVWLRLPGAEPALAHVEIVPRLAAAWGLALADFDPAAWALAELPGAAGEALAAVRDLVADRLKRRPAAVAAEAEEVDEGDEVEAIVAEWLRFYGPLEPASLERVFGLAGPRLVALLASLGEERRIVVDELSSLAGPGRLEVCDADNLERLLRLVRREARPVFEAKELAELPLFLATHQGLTSPGDGPAALRAHLERLFGLPAPAASWETEILPARLSPYYPVWLDQLLLETELGWFGCGKERIAFALAGDLELFLETAGPNPASGLFPDPRARYTFDDLADASGLGRAELAARLWRDCWAGRVTNDSFQTVRLAIENRFAPPAPLARPATAGRRHGVARWGGLRPMGGSWVLLPAQAGVDGLDALDREELAKERARLLLDRYGVVFRELLGRELPALEWKRVFRALRLMELSGEVLAGHFFRGVPGLQFASHAAFRRLSEPLSGEAIFWLSALDPASLCGLDLVDLKGRLPARRSGNHLVYRGSQLVVTSQGNGQRLSIAVPPDDPDLPELLSFLRVLVGREVQPAKRIEVREINGEAAATSPYAKTLVSLLSATREAGALSLRKRY